MKPSDLRDHIVGTWRCTGGATRDADGRITLALIDGWLTYMPDGHMHVIVTCDPQRSDAAALAATGASIAYHGTWSIDAGQQYVTHHVEGCSVADWIGRDLPRRIALDDDGRTLLLGAALDAQASDRHDWRGGTGTVEWSRAFGRPQPGASTVPSLYW